MHIRYEDEARLDRALEEANDAFWAKIAQAFPEATTGDFPPDLTVTRDEHNEEDVLWWLRSNAPGLVVE